MVREILRMGDPRLLRVSEPVRDFEGEGLKELLADMFDTMRAANGAGLAAPQIGVPLRVVVFGSDDATPNPRYPDADPVPRTVLVNPVITLLSDEMEEGWEGCLSVPGLRGVVPRYTAVRLEYLDRDGTRQVVDAKDFFARVAQHETDHLNGHVYLDRMRDLSTLSHIAEWQRYWLGVREQSD